MSRWKVVPVAAAALALAFVLPAGKGSADTKSIDFESGYTPGSVYGQQNWTGSVCGPVIDQSVVDNASYPAAPASFGTKSFRMSNAAVSGCFTDSFSPGLVNEAGESTAANGGLSGGTRQPVFTAQWTFASSTGGLQPGLAVQVSPDRGDGARMSYVRMRHTATAMDLSFFDVQGTDPPNSGPCFQCANFVETSLGTYNPSQPHTVKLTMNFYDGPGNDVVRVFVDGVLKHTGRSWEDYYFYDTESSPNPPRVSRTVDSLLIRATGTPAPATAGQGFLFDAISYTSGPLTTSMTAGPAILVAVPPLTVNLFNLNAHLTSTDGVPLAAKTIAFSAGSTAVCSAVTNANGDAACNGQASALNVVLALGYDASFAGDGTSGPSSAHGNLARVKVGPLS
jgi:hypothetical protein